MKKSLIALAALAATTAFAQSSVTISGTFDPSFRSTATTYGDGAKVTQQALMKDAQGTTNITFSGVEDLGGGLKAGFLLENDFDAANNPNNNLGSAGGQLYTNLSGSFGTIALGKPNTISLTTQTASQPFGTKIGSGFSSAYTGRVRFDNSIVYTSPTIAGFKFMGTYANPTKATAAAAASATAGAYAQGAVSTAPITDFGVLYANGPLSAGISMFNQAATDATGTATASLFGVVSKNTQTNAYAAYDFGVAKLGLGYVAEKQDNTGAFAQVASGLQAIAKIDLTAVNVGLTVPVSANLSLLGSYTKKDDKTTLNLDRTVYGVGAKYTFSKTTSIYARVTNDKVDNLAATATKQAKEVSSALVGMNVNF